MKGGPRGTASTSAEAVLWGAKTPFKGAVVSSKILWLHEIRQRESFAYRELLVGGEKHYVQESPGLVICVPRAQWPCVVHPGGRARRPSGAERGSVRGQAQCGPQGAEQQGVRPGRGPHGQPPGRHGRLPFWGVPWPGSLGCAPTAVPGVIQAR